MFPSLWAFRWHRSSWRENLTRKKRLEWEETLLIPKSNKWNPKKRQVNKKAKKERKKETNKQPMQKIVFNWLLKKNDRGCFFLAKLAQSTKISQPEWCLLGFLGGQIPLKQPPPLLGEFPTGPGTWSLLWCHTCISQQSLQRLPWPPGCFVVVAVFAYPLCWRERNQKKNAIQRGWFCSNLESQPDFVFWVFKMHAMIIVSLRWLLILQEFLLRKKGHIESPNNPSSPPE